MMTRIEALDWIKGFQDNIIREFDFDDKRFRDALEATQIAKKALKKQIPRKPINTDWIYCPNCEKDFGLWGEEKFCSNCGQKIDWGE